jgi:hypothetical protein
MGIDPERVDYLRLASTLGHIKPHRIEQRGEAIRGVQTNFDLVDEFKRLRIG